MLDNNKEERIFFWGIFTIFVLASSYAFFFLTIPLAFCVVLFSTFAKPAVAPGSVVSWICAVLTQKNLNYYYKYG